MKKNKWLVPTITILIIIAVVFFFLKNNATNSKLTYTTVEIEKGKITQTVVTTGTLQPVTSVQVGAQVSGKIEKLYVDYNSRVKKGQLLATIDPSISESKVEESRASYDSSLASSKNVESQYKVALANVKKAQAATKTAMAKQEVAKANLESAKNALNSSKASYEKSKATLENRKLDYERAESLYQQNFISASERDTAETNYKIAQADITSAQAAINQAEASLKSAQLNLESATYDLESTRISEDSAKFQADSSLNQVKSSLAQVSQAKSRLNQAEVDLSYTKIYSPIDGIVTKRAVSEGQTVASSFNTPELFTIVEDLTNMEVIANVDEADIGKVAEKMDTTFTVDAFPTDTFTGVVKQVRKVSTVESGVVTYQAVISAHNPEEKLMPGMTANITIISKVSDECLKVPNAALRFKAEKIPDFPMPDRPPRDGKRPDKKPSDFNDKDGQVPPSDLKDKPSSPSDSSGLGGRRRHKKPDDAEKVWVLTKDGNPKPVILKVGITGGNYTEVVKVMRGELKEGDQVITAATKGNKKDKKSKNGKNNNQRGPGGPGGPMRV